MRAANRSDITTQKTMLRTGQRSNMRSSGLIRLNCQENMHGSKQHTSIAFERKTLKNHHIDSDTKKSPPAIDFCSCCFFFPFVHFFVSDDLWMFYSTSTLPTSHSSVCPFKRRLVAETTSIVCSIRDATRAYEQSAHTLTKSPSARR